MLQHSLRRPYGAGVPPVLIHFVSTFSPGGHALFTLVRGVRPTLALPDETELFE